MRMSSRLIAIGGGGGEEEGEEEGGRGGGFFAVNRQEIEAATRLQHINVVKKDIERANE